ncbi:MAG: hypothetical protein FWD38_04805 [Oscillospiraceae bacterium]|nr:hypothetical protein [Oscillospiraceae bacterium]
MKKKRRSNTLILVLISVAIGVFLLTIGPLIINYIFMAETSRFNLTLAFDAGNLLDYYGAVLGGLVTCFAIISAIHINNLNIKEDRQRVQFERAYEVYHKLPDILAKLDSSAIHLQYSVHISEAALLETLDTMKECDSILREQHYINEKYYNKNIDALLKNIADISSECQGVAERFLIEKEKESENYEPPHAELEAAFGKLRDSIANAKNEIMTEINKFMFGNDG